MKRIIVSLTTLMLVGITSVFAYQPQWGQPMSPEQFADSRVADMDKRLELTDDQETKLKAIYKDSFANMPVMDMQMGEEQRTKMMEYFKATEEKVEAVLTDAQKVEYKKMREEQRARFGGH